MRCDVCGIPAEKPWWDHTAEPKVDIGDHDGQWLVCDPCHQSVVARDLVGLTRRIWAGLAIISPVTVRPGPGATETRAVLVEKAREMLVSLDDGVRVQL